MDRQAVINELRGFAEMHEADRKVTLEKGDMAGAAYHLGRIDAYYAAAGLVAHAAQVHDDETAQAIERLDSHKHAGDLLVGYAGR